MNQEPLVSPGGTFYLVVVERPVKVQLSYGDLVEFAIDCLCSATLDSLMKLPDEAYAT